MGDQNQVMYLKKYMPAAAGPVLEVGSKVEGIEIGDRVSGQGNHASHGILRSGSGYQYGILLAVIIHKLVARYCYCWLPAARPGAMIIQSILFQPLRPAHRHLQIRFQTPHPALDRRWVFPLS